MHAFRSGSPPRGRSTARSWMLTFLVATAGAGCTSYDSRVVPLPLASNRGGAVSLQGALIALEGYVEQKQAKSAFGFDIRSAGLLPLRFSIDNQSPAVVRVNPLQTFLIDRQGRAWPLLTADQAYQRVLGAVALTETGKQAALSGLLGGGVGALTALAIGVVVGGPLGDTVWRDAVAGAYVGTFQRGSRDTMALEDRIRTDLINHTLQNHPAQPGALAHGCLFFPGDGEAESASTLRLGLEFDGYPQAAEIPLMRPLDVEASD